MIDFNKSTENSGKPFTGGKKFAYMCISASLGGTGRVFYNTSWFTDSEIEEGIKLLKADGLIIKTGGGGRGSNFDSRIILTRPAQVVAPQAQPAVAKSSTPMHIAEPAEYTAPQPEPAAWGTLAREPHPSW